MIDDSLTNKHLSHELFLFHAQVANIHIMNVKKQTWKLGKVSDRLGTFRLRVPLGRLRLKHT